jgi:diguanylate cyclase (GGDEF)-like protein
MNFSTLPNLIALAILVAVFWAISRKATSEQVKLWLVGWAFILLHFAAQFPVLGNGFWGGVAIAISLGSLIVASIAFLISVAAVASTFQRQVQFAIAIGIPTLAYTIAAIWGVASPYYYYLAILVGAAAPLLMFLRYNHQGKLYAGGAILSTLLVGTVATWGVAKGHPEIGLTVILTSLNFVVSFLYWNQHKRITAGVLTAVSGFALWGAVFPTAALLQIYLSSVKVEAEVWNIPKYLVAVGMILTLLEDQIEKSTYLAYHDELTELPNRRLLEDRLEQALAQADRSAGKVAVLVLDLDRFKEVNDNYGHRIGDIALRKVVSRLASRIRASDTLARSGGDEFTVVSHVADCPGAEVLLSALESALAEPIVIEGDHVNTGVSIGMALYPDDGANADQLYAAADRAMYIAKKARNAQPIRTLPQPSPSRIL